MFCQFAFTSPNSPKENLSQWKGEMDFPPLASYIMRIVWGSWGTFSGKLYLDINYPLFRFLSEFILSGSHLHLICSFWLSSLICGGKMLCDSFKPCIFLLEVTMLILWKSEHLLNGIEQRNSVYTNMFLKSLIFYVAYIKIKNFFNFC